MQKQTIHEIQAQKVLNDLREDLFNYFDQNCVKIGYYDEVAEHYSEFVLFDWVTSLLNNPDEMAKQMDYKNFVDWFTTFYKEAEQPSWVRRWTKELAVTYFKILTEKQK